jgi:hypothetical protein
LPETARRDESDCGGGGKDRGNQEVRHECGSVNWFMAVELLPPYDRGPGKAPVYPYAPKSRENPAAEGLWLIVDVSDAATAVEDQVVRLGSLISRADVEPFYRLLWRLNTDSYKTTQSLLFFTETVDPPQRVFQSRVLVVPFSSAIENLVLDQHFVHDLALHLWRILSGLASLHHVYISVGALAMLYGVPPTPPNSGYCLELVIRSAAPTQREAVRK